MSMIKCGECRGEISSKAAVCPKCGAKNRKRDWGWGKRLMAFLGVLFACSLVLTSIERSQSPAAAAATTPAKEALMTAEDKNVVSAANLAIALRNTARDPESFKLAEVLSMPKGAACLDYRARNGFGGMNLESAVVVGMKFKTKGSDGFTDMWNLYCTKTGNDITSQVSSLIQAIDAAQSGR